MRIRNSKSEIRKSGITDCANGLGFILMRALRAKPFDFLISIFEFTPIR